uniref:Uncharacterized protein n=1 Tax=Arundo donax TaxID=35708 RepID=A0A0A9CM39_ARUDO
MRDYILSTQNHVPSITQSSALIMPRTLHQSVTSTAAQKLMKTVKAHAFLLSTSLFPIPSRCCSRPLLPSERANRRLHSAAGGILPPIRFRGSSLLREAGRGTAALEPILRLVSLAGGHHELRFSGDQSGY